MVQVHFENIESILSLSLAQSKRRIYLAVAWFTNNILFDELIKARQRNVEVKVLILDDILNRNEFGLDFGLLVNMGADLRLANPQRTMHNKFCVIDDEVYTGSYNWTYQANANHENIVVMNDSDIVASYLQQFERLFSSGVSIITPYEHLRWTDIKEGDFTELRRNIYKDVIAKNDVHTELKKNKLKKLNTAYKNGNAEEIASVSLLPTKRTIIDVLTSSSSFYELKLWKEIIVPNCQLNSPIYTKPCKWLYIPYEILVDKRGSEYIEGKLKYYPIKNYHAGGLPLNIYDKLFVATIKKFQPLSPETRKSIPEDILIIESAQLFNFQFSEPMFNKMRHKTWENSSPKTIHGISVFGIVKEKHDNHYVYYEGWNPQERFEKIKKGCFEK